MLVLPDESSPASKDDAENSMCAECLPHDATAAPLLPRRWINLEIQRCDTTLTRHATSNQKLHALQALYANALLSLSVYQDARVAALPISVVCLV